VNANRFFLASALAMIALSPRACGGLSEEGAASSERVLLVGIASLVVIDAVATSRFAIAAEADPVRIEEMFTRVGGKTSRVPDAPDDVPSRRLRRAREPGHDRLDPRTVRGTTLDEPDRFPAGEGSLGLGAQEGVPDEVERPRRHHHTIRSSFPRHAVGSGHQARRPPAGALHAPIPRASVTGVVASHRQDRGPAVAPRLAASSSGSIASRTTPERVRAPGSERERLSVP
jgi:hypothetical protein